jgi:hypothetical protein
MKKKTRLQQEEEYKRADPAELQAIRTVYGEILHIKLDAFTGKHSGPGRLIPVYHPDGRRMIEESPIDGKKYFYQIMLHPDNIDHPVASPRSYSPGDRVLVNKHAGIVKKCLPGDHYRVEFSDWPTMILHIDHLLLAPPENDMKGQSFREKE